MDVLVEEFEKCNLKKKKGAHIQAFINQEKRAYDKWHNVKRKDFAII